MKVIKKLVSVLMAGVLTLSVMACSGTDKNLSLPCHSPENAPDFYNFPLLLNLLSETVLHAPVPWTVMIFRKSIRAAP